MYARRSIARKCYQRWVLPINGELVSVEYKTDFVRFRRIEFASIRDK